MDCPDYANFKAAGTVGARMSRVHRPLVCGRQNGSIALHSQDLASRCRFCHGRYADLYRVGLRPRFLPFAQIKAVHGNAELAAVHFHQPAACFQSARAAGTGCTSSDGSSVCPAAQAPAPSTGAINR